MLVAVEVSLRDALDNYRRERRRLTRSRHPRVGCNCSYCDAIRAADLLFRVGQALQVSIEFQLKNRITRQEAK